MQQNMRVDIRYPQNRMLVTRDDELYNYGGGLSMSHQSTRVESIYIRCYRRNIIHRVVPTSPRPLSLLL